MEEQKERIINMIFQLTEEQIDEVIELISNEMIKT